MKFKPNFNIPSEKKLISYFIKHGIFKNQNETKLLKKINNPFSDEHITRKKIKQFGPELDDLYRLHQIVINYKRVTILEFGIGWSTKIFANALLHNKDKFINKVKKLRFNNPFEIHAVDNFNNYISSTKKILNHSENAVTKIKFSPVLMTKFNGRICTEYKKLPLINPDLIYLDGPSLFNVKGSINGISTAHPDFMPMSCDILKIESFLKPGTIIIIDGRTSNYRFLLNNLQRNWISIENFKHDQYFLILDEKPLGRLNREQIRFHYNT